MKILTFDIEDWFHILDYDGTRDPSKWINYPSRIHRNMDIIYEILQDKNIKATFFVLAWIAEKYPEIIKKISDLGYEIGSHTYAHQLVYEQSRNGFKNDVEKSIKIIEDLTGKKVKCFRAPGFSITKDNLWALEVIKELGIEYDSSIFPAVRSHGGLKINKLDKPCIISYKNVKIKEFPINTNSILNTKYVFSGGGYFRIIPYFMLKRFFKKSDYVMTYFHPRDFDHKQPTIKNLPKFRMFK